MTDIIVMEEFGDMVASKPDGFSVHGCNAQGAMGSGIAKAVRATYPKVYKTYYTQMLQGHKVFHPGQLIGTHIPELEMGTIIPVKVSDDIVFINAITQRWYKGHINAPKGLTRFVSYDAVEECFAKIDQLPYEYPSIEPTLHMPLLGAGLGGGDWKIIEVIAKRTLKNLDLVVWRLDNAA